MVAFARDAAALAGGIEADRGEGVLAALRHASARWARRDPLPRVTSGVEELDALLAGGWPCGKVGEIVGPASSGRTAVAMATTAAATGRGEIVAWIDASDALDPASAQRCGVELERVLWVRASRVEQAVRAAELVLETGGIPVITLDVAGCAGTEAGWLGGGSARPRGGSRLPRPPLGEGGNTLEGQRFPQVEGSRERRNTLALRLARAAERARAVVLVVAERPWAGSHAGVQVSLQQLEVVWGGESDRSRWLWGLSVRAALARHDAAAWGRTELCCSWEEGARERPALRRPPARCHPPAPRIPAPRIPLPHGGDRAGCLLADR